MAMTQIAKDKHKVKVNTPQQPNLSSIKKRRSGHCRLDNPKALKRYKNQVTISMELRSRMPMQKSIFLSFNLPSQITCLMKLNFWQPTTT